MELSASNWHLSGPQQTNTTLPSLIFFRGLALMCIRFWQPVIYLTLCCCVSS